MCDHYPPGDRQPQQCWHCCKRAARKAEERMAIAQPAYCLALANEQQFLPTLTGLEKPELVEIAQIYNCRVKGNVAKSTLVEAISQVIRDHTEYACVEYEKAKLEYEKAKQTLEELQNG